MSKENKVETATTKNSTETTKTNVGTVKTQIKQKIEKPKKVKPLKQKVEKTLKIKAEKPKKVKKAKKKKTLKQKLVIAFSIFFCVAIFLFGVGSVFTSNDFAMTLVFSQNAEKTSSVVTNVRQDIFNAPYIDMLVTIEAKNINTGNIGYKTIMDMKAVHYLNTNTYEYTALTKISTVPNIKLETYYKNAVLYNKITDKTSQMFMKEKSNSATAQQTLSSSSYFYAFDGNMVKFIFPSDASAPINAMYMIEQNATFHLLFSPFYIGQKIEISYQQDRSEIVKLNYKGEVKQRSYIMKVGSDQYSVTIDYRSTNKIFTLQFPADLNTY